jgi:hypothetical protein
MNSNISIITQVIGAKFKASPLSKKDITIATGLSLNTINNALQGKNMTVSTMFSIMECLGMNLEDLVTEAKSMGLNFPKIVPKTIDDTAIEKLVKEGKSTTEIGTKLNIPEGEVIASVKKSVASTAKPESILEL